MSLRPRARPKQLDLTLRTWGGRRRGAGRRPSGRRPLVSHQTRPLLASRYPVHVSLKLRRDIPNVRSRRLYRPIKQDFIAGCKREGFRVTHYSVQHNHIHLICEAKESRTLSRGIQGLKIRIARGLNRQLVRRGKVFADRFHSRILKTPREVRNALAYVLHNRRSHAKRSGSEVTLGFSSVR